MQATNFKLDLQAASEILNSLGDVFTSQIAVTSRTGHDIFDGVGSINDYPANTERDFDKVNDVFKSTVFEQLIDDIKLAGYSHGRIRLMKLPPKKCYSYHMDCEPRLHFALKTNDSSFLIVESEGYVSKEVIHIPADGVGYIVDTTRKHTALNAGSTDRIHLVVDLLIPVKRKPSFFNMTYEILGKEYSQYEFDKWLIETKPVTEPKRQDFYFVD